MTAWRQNVAAALSEYLAERETVALCTRCSNSDVETDPDKTRINDIAERLRSLEDLVQSVLKSLPQGGSL